jgi:hypothetical protein
MVLALVALAGQAVLMLGTVFFAAAVLAVLRLFGRRRTQKNDAQDNAPSA